MQNQSVLEKLSKIQSDLKAPKNLWNDFGKYNYRNAEGILDAVKPMLKEFGCSLIIPDRVVEVGGKNYIVATAIFTDIETGAYVEVTANARESITKKGMDDSQITGTASSYARKYALNGLFLIDDTKDEDTDEHKLEADKKRKLKLKEEERERREELNKIINSGTDEQLNTLQKILGHYELESSKELKDWQIVKALEKIRG